MHDPPPPPREEGVIWSWFFLGMGSGWSGFLVASVVAVVQVPMCDSPVCFFLVVVGLGLGREV